MAALGVELLVEPPDVGRWPGPVLLAISAVYLPAVWASLRPTPQRQAIQRGVVIASLVMVVAGLPFFSLTIALVLLPATGLLAIASGLVFGRSDSGRRARG